MCIFSPNHVGRCQPCFIITAIELKNTPTRLCSRYLGCAHAGRNRHVRHTTRFNLSLHLQFCRPANPAYTADELKYQLETTKAKLIITHPVCLKTASSVANVPIVVLDSTSGKLPYGAVSVDQLVSFGASRAENYTPIHLKPGEAKKTLAFLSFSSGTTGKPKVRRRQISG